MNALEPLLALLLCLPPSVLQSTDGNSTGKHTPESLEKCVPYETTFSTHVDTRTAHRSAAPWTYIPHRVTDRIPETIFIAKCDENACQNLKQYRVVTPVNMTMPVFYRRHSNNTTHPTTTHPTTTHHTTHYSLVIEKFSFTVSCTCTHQKRKTR